jgi:competence protein ComEC
MVGLEREIARASGAYGRPPAGLWEAEHRSRPWLRALNKAAEATLDRGHGLAWWVLLLGAGLLAYFTIPYEPRLWALTLASIALLAMAWAVRQSGWLYAVLASLAVACGMTLAAGHARLSDAPMILEEWVGEVSGRVARIEQRSAGRARVTLQDLSLEGITAAQTPRAVRFTLVAEPGEIFPGDRLTALVQLGPPPEPVMPGARNVRRELYFAGIGATGFAYGRARSVERSTADLRTLESANAYLQHLRITLAERFSRQLSGTSGALAATLLVGKRDGLSEEATEALRRAGLAHLLAISGMHMAMMTLSALALVRLVLALSPAQSSSMHATRWAAAAALIIATGYLALSGASTATQRAFIMIAIALLAMMTNRRALTIRAVALAAFLVLLLHPQALLGPSFQMSFAATLALVASYAGFSRSATVWRWRLYSERMPALVRKPVMLLVGIALTSLIAGLATAPFAAFHFSTATPLSLLGNVLALPLVSLIIMPAGLVALLLTPFALEGLPLEIMGWGLDGVMVIAHWVAAMDASRVAIQAIRPEAIALVTLAGCVVALLAGWARLMTLPVILLVLGTGVFQPSPAVLIERQGNTVALATEEGLQRSVTRGSRYSVEMWHERLGLEIGSPDTLWNCDPLGCIAPLGNGGLIAHVFEPAALEEDCHVARIVVTALPVPQGCTAAHLIDARMLRRSGAIALVHSDTGFDLWPSFTNRTRPWEVIAE